MKILIVEDETIPAHFLKTLLEKAGWTVVGLADRASKALQLAQEHRPDTVLMDVMIKGAQSGCEAALEIRRILPETAIVFITAYADEEMIGYAVDAKAEGYLLKPYNEKEITATLRLIERRLKKSTPAKNPARVLLVGGFEFDPERPGLFCGGKEVRLSAQMHALLKLLAQAPGHIVPVDRIHATLWANEAEDSARLRVLVYRIKQKTGFELVENHRGLGYRLRMEGV